MFSSVATDFGSWTIWHFVVNTAESSKWGCAVLDFGIRQITGLKAVYVSSKIQLVHVCP